MKLRYSLITVLLGFSALCAAQPSGTISAGANDVAFKTETDISVAPSEIVIRMDLKTSSEKPEDMKPNHLSTQKYIFGVLDELGAAYEGQSENDIVVRQNRQRNSTTVATSTIMATVYTDNQLMRIAELIQSTNTLSFKEHSVNYREEDSLEGVHKSVVDGLIAQSQEHQTKSKNKLRPVGFSQLEADSEAFGGDVVQNMLERNEIPNVEQLSSETFELIGYKHKLVAELIFREQAQ